VPEWLNYDLWQGPAPEKEYRDNIVHYNWHWLWHWGTAELGNNGVHLIDICRWGLGVDYPTRVVSGGGRYRDQERVRRREAPEGTWLFGRATDVPQGGWMRVDFPRDGAARLAVFEFRDGETTEAFSMLLE